MQRYAAFDPPEYLEWKVDPRLGTEYRDRLGQSPEKSDIISMLEEEQLLSLYRDLLLTRLFDIGLKRWVRTGVISKAWLSTGEEAVTVGSVAAVQPGSDVVSPMIRNAGSLHMMGMPIDDMFRGYLATSDAPNAGRDLHIGDLAGGIIQPVSHMGINVPVLAGTALAFKRRGEKRVAMTWIGDGATRCTACHEGVNFAAVQGVPVVFVVQNNQVALGTRVEQHGRGSMSDWAKSYGIPSYDADGNNVLDVYAATALAVARCRRGDGPAAVIATTFRMGGHATHDEQEARDTFPDELFTYWGKRDPIGLFEHYLIEGGIRAPTLHSIEEEAIERVESAASRALQSKERLPHPNSALYEGFSEGGTLVGLENRPI